MEKREDLEEKIRTGVAWSGLTQVALQLANLIVTIVLTRLLLPEDFGLLGMVAVFTGFAAVFVDIGFGAALIQKLDLEQHHKNAVFWFNIAVGASITLILAAAAPYIASFYGEPALQPMQLQILRAIRRR